MEVVVPVVNSRLSENDPSASSRSMRSSLKVFCFAIACSLPVLVPSIHLYLFSWWWKKYEFNVDRDRCRCPCWDTVFKGPYESGAAAYKHIYFNVTPNTFKIWATTVVYLVALYEAAKRVSQLVLLRQLRLPMLVLLAFGIYPNYYGWWAYFNYWNDEYYNQWYHQLYFSSTELLSTFFVVRLLDARRLPLPRELLVILTVAFTHISASFYDQFLYNVLKGEGSLHQVLRDFGLMIPDLLHLWLPWRELRKISRPLKTLFTPRDLTAVAAFFLVSWLCILFF